MNKKSIEKWSIVVEKDVKCAKIRNSPSAL